MVAAEGDTKEGTVTTMGFPVSGFSVYGFSERGFADAPKRMIFNRPDRAFPCAIGGWKTSSNQ